MSAPQDRNQVAVVGSQVLGVFLVMITLLTQHGELRSSRPTGSKNQAAAKEDKDRNKFARLWEDPLEDLPTFQVVAVSPSPSPTPNLADGGRQADAGSSSASQTPIPRSTAAPTTDRRGSRHQTHPTASPLPSPTPSSTAIPAVTLPQTQGMPVPSNCPPKSYTFLWNIIDARPLPETIEARIRVRYAVVSAILADGYLPLRESLLSPLFIESGDNSPEKMIGRFESFRKPPDSEGEKTCRYVSVIWTPKQLDFKRINKKENFWFEDEEQKEIKKIIWKKDVPDGENKSFGGDFWVLHHGSSDDLVNLSAAMAPSPPPLRTSFVRATVPLESLVPPPQPGWKCLQKITTDDELVRSLVHELCLRIPALNDHSKAPPRLVVFTESDTTYSRAITRTLKDRLKDKAVVEIYSYLRALDGRPDESRIPATGDSSKSQEPGSLLQRRAISESSFGTSQFDYLRRTALELKTKHNGPQQDVVAVGILGSDVYDKMLVLQAVRPMLPGAVFFTTDLDALYLERTMQPFTRNLVVASADDINANESSSAAASGWQLPLMRDSYQTVLVKEVRNILRWQDRQTGSSATPTPTASPVARIFEIGAGNPLDLADAAGTSCPRRWLTTPIFGPMRWLAQRRFNLLIFLPALGNAFLILWAATTRLNSRSGAMESWANCLVYGETILAAFFTIVLLFVLTLLNPIIGMLDSLFGFNFGYWDFLFGEPLSLGMTIWPSVMIRCLAFGVAIFLLALASYSFVVDGLDQKSDLEKALGGTLHMKKHAKVVSKSFAHFFDRLFGQSRLRWRIMGLSIAYLVVSFVLFMIWQPTVPGRGGLALLFEKVVLALGVALYIVHLIFCFDLHFSAFRLLRAIHSHFDLGSPTASASSIDLKQMFASLATLTAVIGKTLLYPLTVLILIILSRLTIFDNWVMTPSLMITFLFGPIAIVTASLFLWAEGARLKKLVLAQTSVWPAERSAVQEVNNGVFAAWYRQPIVSALYSLLAVFGSVGIAGPLIRLFSESY